VRQSIGLFLIGMSTLLVGCTEEQYEALTELLGVTPFQYSVATAITAFFVL